MTEIGLIAEEVDSSSLESSSSVIHTFDSIGVGESEKQSKEKLGFPGLFGQIKYLFSEAAPGMSVTQAKGWLAISVAIFGLSFV